MLKLKSILTWNNITIYYNNIILSTSLKRLRSRLGISMKMIQRSAGTFLNNVLILIKRIFKSNHVATSSSLGTV